MFAACADGLKAARKKESLYVVLSQKLTVTEIVSPKLGEVLDTCTEVIFTVASARAKHPRRINKLKQNRRFNCHKIVFIKRRFRMKSLSL
jgi:predicted house-cleaning noncanonical NTP pyrophosphatase (MazG superfamily)